MRSARRLPAAALGAVLTLTVFGIPLHAQVPDPILPNPQLTPGATVVVGREAMCTPGYSRGVRYVPADVHRQVFREYGLIDVPTRDYEVDHLIPLSIGGSNDIANLWPQSRRTHPWNAGAKDALEARLHELVCFGNLDLRTAQEVIRGDWIAAYKRYVGPEPEHVRHRRH